ncbi:MAG: POTRA domain-containing protein, partial [Thiohalorhabdaceae bacterium]
MPLPMASHGGAGPGLARAFVFLCLLPGLSLGARADGDGVAVAVSGVSGEIRDNVRAFLSITELTDTDDVQPKAVRRAHRRAPDEIRHALQPFGYYDPTIRTELESGADGWTARYQVDPGPAVRVTGLEVAIAGSGKANEALREVIAESPLQRGKRLDHSDYTATKRQLIETAVEQGYLDATYRRSELRVQPEAGKAEIHLVLA